MDVNELRSVFAYPESLGRNGSVSYWYSSQVVANTSLIFMRVLKRKADILNTNWPVV